jgi:predicted GIY-YIG superfamily endonuclease
MHSRGVASKYTRTRLPVKLVYLEPQRDRASASRRELQIKKMSRARKRALTHRKDLGDHGATRRPASLAGKALRDHKRCRTGTHEMSRG